MVDEAGAPLAGATIRVGSLDTETTATGAYALAGLARHTALVGVELDGLYLGDDITFITGPFFSPAMYRELVMPSARKICDYVHDNGGHVYFHSDGNNWQLIPLLIEAGIDMLDPLEVKAGMDLRELKDAFGRQQPFSSNLA